MPKLITVLPLLALASCYRPPAPVVPDTKTERQMIGLLAKFDLWDYDGNGKLDAKELRPASKMSGRPVSEIIGYYDTNKDQQISLHEAQRGLDRHVEEHDSGNH
ncbi:MAG: EF-hand domain-containing protein [Luteolibacter sp.]